jgi:hypothetical protein
MEPKDLVIVSCVFLFLALFLYFPVVVELAKKAPRY